MIVNLLKNAAAKIQKKNERQTTFNNFFHIFAKYLFDHQFNNNSFTSNVL